MFAAVAISAAMSTSVARSETLDELVKKEEGIELGLCNLTPRPDVKGKDVYVVVPARFPSPGIWVTRSILFVGVDDGKNVAGVVEAKTLHDTSPREVISVTCKNNAITIKMSNRMRPATLSYVWDGKGLKPRGGTK